MNLYVTELGAVGDGVTLNTKVINEAIERVSEAGGGQVIVPPGKFVSGTVFLKNNVHLYLEPGAVLFGSTNINDYHIEPHTDIPFIYAKNVENVGVEGYGMLEIDYAFEEAQRPTMVVPQYCTNFTMRGITLKMMGGYWLLCAKYCTNVTLDSLILESRDSDNGDGLDFEGSRNVTISNCKIHAGDDSISLKTGNRAEPCENFVITNCVFSSNWAGVRIGPESGGDMRNITISNCVFNDCSDALKIQLTGPTVMEDMVFSNLVMVNTCRALCMTYSPPYRGTDDENAFRGKFHRMRFDNIIFKNGGRAAHQRFHEEQMLIMGMPNAPIEDISFSNVKFICSGDGEYYPENSILSPDFLYCGYYPEFLPMGLRHGQDNSHPAACMHIYHAENIRFTNCTFETVLPDKRPMIVANDVKGLTMLQSGTTNDAELMRYYDVEGLTLFNCDGPVLPVSDKDAALCEEFKQLTAHNMKMERASHKYRARLSSMNCVATVECGKKDSETTFSFTQEGKDAYIVINGARGSVQVVVNGEPACRWDRHECAAYDDDHARLIMDISNFVRVGENEISVVLEGSKPHFRNGIAVYTL